MKKNPFPGIALTLGIVLSMLTLFGSTPMENGNTRLPVLMLLLACEFGFIVTLVGGIMGFNQLRKQAGNRALAAISTGCTLLAINFVYLGLQLWSALSP
ncbi:MAG: hypothetical protein OQL16_10170 [Gammaproteobacteria bacterium]|nr:hypothetical protein [Gammaproteobacteria bacterium]